MTDHDSTLDQANSSSEIRISSVTDIHRPISTAEVAIGEANHHLAAVYDVVADDSMETDDIHTAELRALQHSLREGQQAISKALERVRQIESERKEDGEDTYSGDDLDNPVKNPIPELLWNTTPPMPPKKTPINRHSGKQRRFESFESPDGNTK